MLLKLSTIIFFYDGTFLYISSIIKQLTNMKKFTISAKVFHELQELLETFEYIKSKFPSISGFETKAFLNRKTDHDSEIENQDKLKLALIFDRFYKDKNKYHFERSEFTDIHNLITNQDKGQNNLDELQIVLFENYSITEDELNLYNDLDCNIRAMLEIGILCQLRSIYLTEKQCELVIRGLKECDMITSEDQPEAQEIINKLTNVRGTNSY